MEFNKRYNVCQKSIQSNLFGEHVLKTTRVTKWCTETKQINTKINRHKLFKTAKE